MNSMRRAALRAAMSASRVPSTKPQMLGVASQITSLSVARIAAPIAARCFSLTARVAEETSNSMDSALSQGPNSSSPEPGFGIFVRNMVFEANEDHLREAYGKFGEITKVVVARDARGLSRGYGFVWFTNAEAQEAAVSQTNLSFWHGRRISVAPRTARARNSPGAAVGPTCSLYVGNIPYETTDAELNKIFRELDNVKDVRVAVDRTTGWPRGFAHADFADVDSCMKAHDRLQGTTIGGRELRIDYASENPNPTKTI